MVKFKTKKPDKEGYLLTIYSGIKYHPTKEIYKVISCARHPITRQSVTKPKKRTPDGKRITSLQLALKCKGVYDEKLREQLFGERFPYYVDVAKEALERMVLDGIGKNTIYNYESSLRKYTFNRWKSKRINEITSMDIYQIFDENLSSWSDHHKKSMRKYIKYIFSFAVEREYVGTNPMPRIKCKVSKKLTTVLTQKEIVILIDRAVELGWIYKEIVYLAVMLGLRSGELKALKWICIDFDTGTITVKYSMLRDGTLKETKTGEDRKLPMTKPVRKFLLKLKEKTGQSEYVLPRVESWMKGEQARELRSFLREIGLPEIRFHDLRASWATMLLVNGLEPVKLMALGGWKELKTLDHYVRLAGVHVKDSLESLNSIEYFPEMDNVLEMTPRKR